MIELRFIKNGEVLRTANLNRPSSEVSVPCVMQTVTYDEDGTRSVIDHTTPEERAWDAVAVIVDGVEKCRKDYPSLTPRRDRKGRAIEPSNRYGRVDLSWPKG